MRRRQRTAAPPPPRRPVAPTPPRLHALLRHAPPLLLACLLAVSPLPARAAGIGEGGSGAVLGQPLDFVVQLRTDPGELLTAECLAAEVTAGDRRLPAPLVRTVLERGTGDALRVRVQTTQGIDEPVIGVLLQVGCSNRVSRRFVVLADPPGGVQPPAMAAVPLVQPAGVASPGQGAGELGPGSSAPRPTERLAQLPRPAPAATPTPRPQASTPTPTPTPAGAEALRPRPGVAAPAPAATRPAADERAAERRAQPATPAAAAPAAAAAAQAPATARRADAAPRLRLDMVEPGLNSSQVIEQALQAVAEAASATRAANAAAAAADQRIAGLERTVEQLRSEARQYRAQANEMRERLRKSEATSPWVWPLLFGLLLLGGLAAWLARELAVLRRAQQRTWQQGLRQAQAEQAQARPSQAAAEGHAASRTPTSPIPFVTSEIVPPPAISVRGSLPPGRAWPPPAPAEAPRTVQGLDTQPPPAESVPMSTLTPQERATHRTMPLPGLGFAAGASSPRDVSIEELIDLEQQAEFFVVLGQDEAAVDLLVEHLRSTGGSSPLPYLKLLEIHHRRGDPAAFERTRQRFNQRFNAYAPEWGVGLQHGRSLEDYAGVLPRLQQVWARPLDAMAELEALLFRKSRGDLFDLPAYRDVLFLYSLARDLLDREAASTGEVDLLLPLADGGNFGPASAHPYLGLERDSVFDSASSDEVPTSPVDLDLSGADRPAGRIFDPLATSRARP